MMFNVPQFIDVEDKIVGPLTWKQLLWLIAMGAILLIIFAFFETGFAIVLGVPIVLLFVALAFYKPNGFPLAHFLFHGVFFFFRPKVAVWERPTRGYVHEQKTVEKKEEIRSTRDVFLTADKIKELARSIDSKQ